MGALPGWDDLETALSVLKKKVGEANPLYVALDDPDDGTQGKSAAAADAAMASDIAVPNSSCFMVFPTG